MLKKSILYSFIFTFGIFVILSSCNKKRDNPQPSSPQVVGNNSNLTVKSDNAISKKWFVNTSGQKVSGATVDYLYFDFLPYGRFVIQKTDSTIIEGAYVYDAANNKIILTDIGEITINSISGTSFSFTVTMSGGSPITISSTSGTADNSSKALQFARVWKLTKQTVDGQDSGILSMVDSAYVVVSKYGTHMLAFKGGLLGDDYIPQVWKWSDATQGSICVGDFVPDCSSQLQVNLTSDNKLIVEYTDGGEKYHEEYSEIKL
jgi:hypothetical protein